MGDEPVGIEGVGLPYDPAEFPTEFVATVDGQSLIIPAPGLVATTCADHAAEVGARQAKGWRQARKGAGHIVNEEIFIEKAGFLYQGDGPILVMNAERHAAMRANQAAKRQRWKDGLNAPTQGIPKEFEEVSEVVVGEDRRRVSHR